MGNERWVALHVENQVEKVDPAMANAADNPGARRQLPQPRWSAAAMPRE
jgi:hypothetical protein